MSVTPPSLRAAFTTNSLTWIDADFSACRHVVTYHITPSGAEFLDVAEFAPPPPEESGTTATPAAACCGGPGPGEAGPRFGDRFASLDQSGVLFTAGLSDRAAMRLADTGTFPVVVEHRRVIDDVLARLQALMRHDPPLWLCRRIRYAARPHDCPRY